jgi:hypothetical protein
MKLRRLTPNGIAQFTAYLTNLKTDPSLAPPKHLLSEDGASEPVGAEVELEERSFATRLNVAKYLDEMLSPAKLPQIERDVGLWTWLTLFYFDQLCPPGRSGRKVFEHARYVPQVDMSRRYYRHMLLGPWMMFIAHRDRPERLLALLSNPLDVATSETYRLFIENPSLIACTAVVETATWLYFDYERSRLKRGAGSKDAGGCRRLIEFLQQIDCTFDLPILTQAGLSKLLPDEFKRFVPRQTALIN